jgi:hypothetical protein
VQIAGDLPRRILPIRIVAPEDAYTRTGFKRPNLIRYVEENRGPLVRACLTVLSAYCRADLPSQRLKNFGSFEPLSDLVRSALVWLGLPDPCASRDEVEQVDEARETETAFFTALRVFAGSQETQKTSAEIHAIALRGDREGELLRVSGTKRDEDATALRAALYDVMGLDPAVAVPNAKAIGRHLSRLREKTRGGLRLVHNPDRDTKVARWFVTDKARSTS